MATAITLCGLFYVLHDFGWATTFLELMSMSFLPNSMQALSILYELCFACFEVCKTSFKLFGELLAVGAILIRLGLQCKGLCFVGCVSCIFLKPIMAQVFSALGSLKGASLPSRTCGVEKKLVNVKHTHIVDIHTKFSNCGGCILNYSV